MNLKKDWHTIIEYKGKTIHYFDYSYCKDSKEIVAIIDAIAEFMRNSEGDLLTLDNTEGIITSKEIMEKTQKLSKEVFQYKRKKGAVLGISGMKQLFLKTYNLFSKDKIVPFNSKEEALEYLVKD